MSESEIKQARMDVERSSANLEDAVDRLLTQVEEGAEKISHIGDRTKDFTSKVRQMVDVDHVVNQVEDSFARFLEDSSAQLKGAATDLLSDLRESAEEQFKRLDSRPLATWSAFAATGFALGYFLAKRR